MAVSEHDWHKVHQSLIAQLGEPEADSLMEMLPRDGWENLATKTDLHLLRADIDVRLAQTAAGFHRDMVRQTWISVATTLTALGALGGLLH